MVDPLQSLTRPAHDRQQSFLRADLARIADRFEQANNRLLRSQTIEDYADAEEERRDIAGEFWAAESELADLALLLLRLALRHQPEALATYLAEALRSELQPLADAIARLEARK